MERKLYLVPTIIHSILSRHVMYRSCFKEYAHIPAHLMINVRFNEEIIDSGQFSWNRGGKWWAYIGIGNTFSEVLFFSHLQSLKHETGEWAEMKKKLINFLEKLAPDSIIPVEVFDPTTVLKKWGQLETIINGKVTSKECFLFSRHFALATIEHQSYNLEYKLDPVSVVTVRCVLRMSMYTCTYVRVCYVYVHLFCLCVMSVYTCMLCVMYVFNYTQYNHFWV